MSSSNPVALDQEHDDALVVGEGVALGVRPAPFVLRAAGAIIDVLAEALLVVIVIYLTSVVAGASLVDSALVQAMSITGIVLGFVIVPTAVETLTRGRSLGKLAIGARIVRDDGGAISFRHAFIRALTGFIEIVMTFGGLAVVVGLLSRRSKRIGDLLAGTYSQHERVARPVPSGVPVPEALIGWSRTADVAPLPDRLSRRIAQFLRNARHLTPESRARLADELARETAAYVNPVPAAHPELFLVAVAALRREREYRALQLERERLDRLSPVLEALPHGFPRR